MQLEQALAAVKAAGYRVTKPKAKKATAKPKFNALGLPMSASYDPNYKMKYRTPPLSRKQNVCSYVSPGQWAEMCQLAQATWDARMAA